jgi:prepilin peptidase CpaA
MGGLGGAIKRTLLLAHQAILARLRRVRSPKLGPGKGDAPGFVVRAICCLDRFRSVPPRDLVSLCLLSFGVSRLIYLQKTLMHNPMTNYPQASLLILLLTSATLFWVALTDFRNFKIRNDAVLLLAGLYFLYAAVSGRWASIPWNVAFAILTFAGMTYVYAVNKMGGGDIKLLAVAFLWTGPWAVLPFALLLLVFIGVHYLAARLGWAAAEKSPAGLRIPLAPSVAGALIGTFALGFVAAL